MLRSNRLVIVVGLLYLLLTTAHIPLNVLNYIFDKNSPLQFVGLLASALTLAVILSRKKSKVKIPLFISATLALLLTSLLISAFLSPDFIGSLTGDTGRYTGLASLCALVVIAIFHANLNRRQFYKLAYLYILTFALTLIIGILQSLDLIEMPGIADSVTSTFGNLDFFAAYIGTTIPLLLVIAHLSPRNLQKYFLILLPIAIYCLYLAGAKQGYVDLGLTLGLIAILLLFKFLKVNLIERLQRISLNLRTAIGVILVVIWMEIIFVSPFVSTSVPIIGGEPQVVIRGVMWLAALNQFRAFPIFGVGPDQYGNYYEQFRSVSSTIVLPGDSSNDAHSAPMQTLATTGAVGSLLFMVLIAILIRSLFILIERNPKHRTRYYLFAIYFFIYFTNAAISPIVLPNKYLFWATAGFIVGQAYRGYLEPQRLARVSSLLSKGTLALSSTLVLVVAINFSYAQIRFINWAETRGPSANVRIDAAVSPFLPCTWYYPALENMVINQGSEALEALALDQVAINPRCFQAQTKLAILAYNRGDIKEMRKRIYIMMDLAPARRDSMDLATIYAIKNGDTALQARIAKILAAQGITTIELR